MSEESKKIETNEEEAKASELSEQDLDNVAGGSSEVINTSRSNVKNN
jgi:hypothetical protein